MSSWISESLLASIPSLIAALIWIIRLGGRLDSLEAAFRKCQTERKDFRTQDARDRNLLAEQLERDRALLAEKIERDRTVMADKLEGISSRIGEIKGELTVIVGLLNKGEHL